LERRQDIILKPKVRVVIYKKNREVIQRYVSPDSDSFSINKKSYIIDKENYYIFKSKATYTYLEDIPTPLTIKNIEVVKGKESVPYEDVLMTADELETFKRSKTAKEILETMNGGLPDNILGLVSIGITAIGLVVIYYLLDQQIQLILQQITELRRLFGVQ